jgi:glycosyltransferase involved in cell wall biosynthesis
MNNKKPLVSVIIPIYNSEKYVSKCIESIINQSYENIEILLINDGSTDKSSEICDAYGIKDDRVKVIHKQNEGVSSARNLGIDEANGEYVSFVDSDDWLVPMAFENIVNCIIMEQVDAVIFEYFVENYIGNKIHNTYTELYGPMNSEKAIETTISPVNRFVWSKVFSRDIIGNTRFDTTIHFGEDTLFTALVMDKANSVYYLSRPLYHYFQSENSATRIGFNPRVFSGVEAYRQLVELCSLKYPSIIDVARTAHKNIIINTIIILLNNPYYVDFRATKQKLSSEFRNGILILLISKKVSFRMKMKFTLGLLSPKLLKNLRS